MIVDHGDDSPDLLTCKGEKMICRNCSREISDEAKFCPYCGNVIEVQPENGAQLGAGVEPEPVMQPEPVVQAEIAVTSSESAVEPGIAVQSGVSVQSAPVAQPETITAQPESVVQPQPILSEKEQRKLEKKQRKQAVHRAVFHPKRMKPIPTAVVSLLMGILMLAFLLMTVCSLIVQYTVKSNALFDTVNRADLNDIYITDIFPEDKLTAAGVTISPEGDNSVYDVMSRAIGFADFTPKVMENITEHSTVKSFLAMTVNHYAYYVITGKDENGVSTKDLKNLIEQTKDTASDYIGYEIPDELMAQLGIEENKNAVAIFNPDKMLKGNSYLTLCAVFFSPVFTVAAFVLTVCMGILLALFTRRLKNTLMVSGICFTVTGVVLLLLRSSLFSTNSIYKLLADALSPARFMGGLVMLLLALVLFFVSAIIKMAGKGVKENEA